MKEKRCIIPVLRIGLARGLACVGFLMAIVLLGWILWAGGPAKPDFSDRAREASRGLNLYDLTMRLDPDRNTLAVTEQVTIRNDTGDTLDSLVLRTYLNAYQDEESSPAALEEIYDACYPEGFSSGYLEMFDVKWQDAFAAWEYLDDAATVMRIAIPTLKPGEEGMLFIRWAAHVPSCAHRTGYADGVWQLGNIVPLLALYENGAWRQDEYAPVGDPFVSECANFRVKLHLPEGYVPACTAPLTETKAGVWEGEALAVRDLALCVSDRYKVAQTRAGDTVIRAYGSDEAGAKMVLAAAQKALTTMEKLYGDYPYPVYSVCQVDFPFGGMEYPGLTMLAKQYFEKNRQDSMELVVAHETAHQWFYGLVGSDQIFAPWQDEALCEWAMLRYVRENYGQGSYDTLRYYRIDAPMQENITDTLTPGSPIDYFSSLSVYSAIVYGRGAALMTALEEMLPGGADAFLKSYAERFAFSYVTRAEFEEYLSEYARMDLSPLVLDYIDTLM